MQHDIVLKELIFDLLTPRVGEGGVCGQNIDYHVAAYVILFHNLICKMTVFWKKTCSEKAEFRPIDPIPRSVQGGGGGSRGRSFDFDLLTPSPGSVGALFHKKTNKRAKWP